MRKVLVLAAVLALGPIVGPPHAVANDNNNETQCSGVLPPGVYQNVVVPPGATCVLFNSTVLEDLTILEGATLEHANTSVGGNIEAEKARRVSLFGGTVGGNIEISETRGDHPLGNDIGVCGMILPSGNVELRESSRGLHIGFPDIGCPPNNVAGSILVTGNFVDLDGHLVIQGNTVGQSLEVSETRGTATKIVNGNTVGERIECTDNDPPFIGGPNTAPEKEGQCF